MHCIHLPRTFGLSNVDIFLPIASRLCPHPIFSACLTHKSKTRNQPWKQQNSPPPSSPYCPLRSATWLLLSMAVSRRFITSGCVRRAMCRGAQSETGPGLQYSEAGAGLRYSEAGAGLWYSEAGPGLRYSEAGPGLRYSETGPGLRYSETGPGLRYSEAGPGLRYREAGPGLRYSGRLIRTGPMTTSPFTVRFRELYNPPPSTYLEKVTPGGLIGATRGHTCWWRRRRLWHEAVSPGGSNQGSNSLTAI